MGLFEADSDYRAFLSVVAETHEKIPCRIVSYCIMPNHWHMLLWPREDGELSEFLRRIEVTHTQRWHAYWGTAGTGALYQGRFKSFPVETDRHLLAAARYIERNAARAFLCKRAEDWRWSSLAQSLSDRIPEVPLSEFPIQKPSDWLSFVNAFEPLPELETLRKSARKGTPFGNEEWVIKTAETLGIQSTLRNVGRPPKKAPK